MSQLQYIKDCIYHLKQEYGCSLEIYNITNSTRNLETGVKTITKTVYKIRRGILLPRKLDNEFLRILGATIHFDLLKNEQRQIILDASDYPSGYEPKINSDYILVDHIRFNILDVETYDHKLAVVFTVKKIVGEQPAAIIEQTISQSIGISQGVENG